MQVADEPLLWVFPGYPNGINDVVAVSSLDNGVRVPVAVETAEQLAEATARNWTVTVKTPNVVRVVRQHFGCQEMIGAEVEDSIEGRPQAHWEERLFQARTLDLLTKLKPESEANPVSKAKALARTLILLL